MAVEVAVEVKVEVAVEVTVAVTVVVEVSRLRVIKKTASPLIQPSLGLALSESKQWRSLQQFPTALFE